MHFFTSIFILNLYRHASIKRPGAYKTFWSLGWALIRRGCLIEGDAYSIISGLGWARMLVWRGASSKLYGINFITHTHTASIQSSASKEDESESTEETLHQQQTQQQQQQETKEETIPTKIGPNLSRLWSYECTATKALTVTCLAWNKQNPVGFSFFTS